MLVVGPMRVDQGADNVERAEVVGSGRSNTETLSGRAQPTGRRPMLSIVTVVLNDASGLEATLRNIALQDFSDFEHIVIDGGSTDETLGVIRACSRIDHWSSGPDDGIYDAMNKGLRSASGRWINFLNAGDSYLSTSALRDLRLETRDSDAIACPTLWKYVNGDEILVGVDQRWRDKLAMPTTHQSILYRTDLLRTLPFDTKYRRAADYHQLLRLANVGRIEYSDVPLARFCEGGFSSSGVIGKIKTLLEYFRAVEEVDERRYSQFSKLQRSLSIYLKESIKSILPRQMVSRCRLAIRRRRLSIGS